MRASETSKRLFVATGAYSCGKTTTLRHLATTRGYRVHGEAHRRVLDELGARTHGHPPDAPFRPIDAPDHVCPLCRKREFAARVLETQKAIEAEASDGDWLERGYLDPVEYYLRTSGETAYPWPPGEPAFERYALVFLFAVMPALQSPRWGRSSEARAAEAERINQRLGALYRAAGFEVVDVGPGTVEERAELLAARRDALEVACRGV
ncbi:ATP/GTP-binding protein [Sorangium sp. So ce394]|uniref:ATP/GTP-binding protein n=1 Tax=Sorangium sp. So ce394 TaxID=3133310 RepID=UPI003F5B545C